MNRIHRTVLNRALNVCQAVSEVASGGRGGADASASAAALGSHSAARLSTLAGACLLALATMGAGNARAAGPVDVVGGDSRVFIGSDSADGLTINVAARPVPEAGINSGFVQFKDNSSAGNATVNNQGSLELRDNATAGIARITNSGGGGTVFWENTTAGTAQILN